MKRIFLIAGITITLASCSNEGDKTASTNQDSATNTTSPSQDQNTTAPPSDHSNMPGKNMMTLMQGNMEQMKAISSTGNPDNDFAALMKVHHMGALEMAQLEVANGTDPELKQMAQKMISDQQKEIAELNTFLSGHSAHGGGEDFYKSVMAGMNNMKMDMDHSGSVDKQFVQMMIPHHQGAIDMARAYIKAGAHEEKLKGMANKIISEQKKEIGELQAWLSKNR